MRPGCTAEREVGESHGTGRRLSNESRRNVVANMSSLEAGTHVLTYASHDEGEDDGGGIGSGRRGDPCFHYTVLDQAWRATNTTSKFQMCDRLVEWKGRRQH